MWKLEIKFPNQLASCKQYNYCPFTLYQEHTFSQWSGLEIQDYSNYRVLHGKNGFISIVSCPGQANVQLCTLFVSSLDRILSIKI